MPEISERTRSAIQQHVLAGYPQEVCGLLFTRPSVGVIFQDRFQPIENIADKLHAMDPQEYPRTARDAFAMNEAKVARLVREAEANGEQWTAIVHSHIDCGAYFSSEDIRSAAPDGNAVYPQLDQIVVDCRAWGIEEARVYRWDAAHRAFIPAATLSQFKCTR